MPAATVIEIVPGLMRETRHDGRAMYYTIARTTHLVIDAYIDDNLKLLHEWPAEKPLYLYHDISAPEVSLTPYFRDRLTEVADVLAEGNVKGYSAVLLENSLLSNLFVVFGRMFSRRAKDTFTQMYFVQPDKAEAWLLSKL